MKTFDLVVHTPKNLQEGGDEFLEKFTAIQALIKFDSIAWRQLLVRQLQFNSENASFTITYLQSQQSLRFTLNAFSKLDDLEFKIESDVAIIVPQKDVFGLITRKTKDYIFFKKLDFATARQYLLCFLNAELQQLEQFYKDSQSKLALHL